MVLVLFCFHAFRHHVRDILHDGASHLEVELRLSVRCLVTVLAMFLECLPSNCLASKVSKPTLHHGYDSAQGRRAKLSSPETRYLQPGPLPIGPVLNR
jgi:hypothetical protein